MHESVATTGHDADAVAASDAQHAECGSSSEHDIALLLVCGAEVEARRTVGEDPRLGLAVGLGLAHECLARSRREVPVDEASVVAGSVGARTGTFAAGPEREGRVITAHAPVDPAPYLELKATQHIRSRCDICCGHGGD